MNNSLKITLCNIIQSSFFRACACVTSAIQIFLRNSYTQINFSNRCYTNALRNKINFVYHNIVNIELCSPGTISSVSTVPDFGLCNICYTYHFVTKLTENYECDITVMQVPVRVT